MESIFLACFVFGALFTLASVALGFAGHGAAHFGHGQGHIGHAGSGYVHAGGHGIDHGGAHGLDHGGAHGLDHGGHGVDHAHGVHGEVPHSDNTTLPWMN